VFFVFLTQRRNESVVCDEKKLGRLGLEVYGHVEVSANEVCIEAHIGAQRLMSTR